MGANDRSIRGMIKDYILITIGILMTAASIVYVFNPNRLAAGGVQGIALALGSLTGIPTGILMIAINAILLFAAFLLMGKSFGEKTLYSSLGLSFAVYFLESRLYHGPLTDDLLLGSIFGSALMGVGVGIILNRGASIGGTSLIGTLINRYLHFEQVGSIVAIDCLVTLFSLFTFGVEIGLYQLLSVYLCGAVINKVIDGFSSRKEVMVITSEKRSIMDFIMKDLNRGATLIKGRGAYTGIDNEIIYSILTRREFIRLKLFIEQHDKGAFLSVNTVTEVSGEGFSRRG